MKSEEIKNLFEQFESASSEIEGVECWSARELQNLLGYNKWENFEKVIQKAKATCFNAGVEVRDHFPDVRKVIEAGKGAKHEIEDILLTRYACYLVAQNGDSRKEEISFAQNYFAVQTRRAELVEQRLLESERIIAREKLSLTEKQLSGILYERGVDSQGFAIIRSKGDQALFRLNTQMLKKKMGIPETRPVADFLPTISIKAKDFDDEKEFLGYKTPNLIIQGSGADMMLQALINIDQIKGVNLLTVVHDEANVAITDERQIEQVRDAMLSASSLRVPMTVDAKVGRNWAEAK